MSIILLFTKAVLNKMVIPKAGRYILRDLKERGLILIVSYGGSMTFYLEKKIKNVSVKIKIGRFPDLSIAYARKKALELKGEIAKVINPMEGRRKENRELKQKIDKQITFEKAYERYINEHSKINNKKS